MSNDPLKIRRIHHVELWVGNALQASYYYRRAFGFELYGYRGLETGSRLETTFALRQNDARLFFTAPLTERGPVSDHVTLHGDGVRDIAFEVDDADSAFAAAVERGAQPEAAPHDVASEGVTVRLASVRTYGDTLHSFISAPGGAPDLLPGFEPRQDDRADPGHSAGLLIVDHIVGNVEQGKMEAWCDFYRDVLGFHRYITFDDKDISTEFSALQSIVMSDATQTVKFPINEPASGRRLSQIQEYLDYYKGAGAQHIALLTDDIVATVKALRAGGVEFLDAPRSYYEGLLDRVGTIDEDLDTLASLDILVDADEEGYLLQIFTKPVEDRPTLFYEIIQRKGCRGFGKGNFKALFVAMEQEQENRGNL